MKIEKRYQELLRIKGEINRRIKNGTGFQRIKDLMLYLAQEKVYSKLKSEDNQLAELDCFFNIWLKEKKRLPDFGLETDIFYKVNSLNEVERKYLKVQYCGYRIENHVPDEYCEQALVQIIGDKLSGLAIGEILIRETKKREENLLYIVHFLRQKGEIFNALLLIQYANENFPANEKLLLEEAAIWLDGKQWQKAMEVLSKIKNPSPYVDGVMAELRQVIEYG